MTGKIARLAPQPGAQEYRGRMQVIWTEKYGWITYKWPRGRGKPVSEAQALTQSQFARIMQVIKVQPAPILESAEEITQNTGWYVRDVLMSAAYGNLISCYDTNGKWWTGRVMAANQIQTYLDSISNVRGTILYRNDDQWIGLPPGNAGDQLIIDTLTGLPNWATGGGGGGGAGQQWAVPLSVGNPATSSTTFNWKGWSFQPTSNFSLYEAMGLFSPTFADTYQAVIAELDGTSNTPKITSLNYSEERTLSADSNASMQLFAWETPVALVPTSVYALMIGRTSSADGTTNGMETYEANIPGYSAPITVWKEARYAKAALAIGDTLDTNSGSEIPLCCYFSWAIPSV